MLMALVEYFFMVSAKVFELNRNNYAPLPSCTISELSLNNSPGIAMECLMSSACPPPFHCCRNARDPQ